MSINWKMTLGRIAPWIAGSLGGPMAGVATEALCRAIGMEPSAENAEAIAELAGKDRLSGTQLLALREAELEHEATMREAGYKSLLDLEAVAAGDRDSARRREMAVLDWTPRILAYGVTAGFFGVLACLLFADLPGGTRDVLNIMLGALGAGWTQVISYYFGSSVGSARKNELLAGKETSPV